MGDFKLAEVFAENDSVRIEIPNLQTFRILYQWLRDHCRCTECYNETTYQRKLSILDFPENIFTQECHLSNGVLNVTWDGGHKSKYDLSWLLKNSKYIGEDNVNKIDMIPWLKLPNISRVHSKSYMNTEAGLTEVISSLLRYGVAIVTDVEPNLSATEETITRLSPVHRTLFGEIWEVNNKGDYITDEKNHTSINQNHQDTAYSNIALGAHTDNTYWCDAAGLQVFHFLKPASTGGETLLVDGLSVINQLKLNHRESYERLTRAPVSAEYIEEGQHHTYVDPIIKLDPVTKKFLQLRFNLYDRSVMRTIPQTEIKQHYNDLRLLASIVADKRGENYIEFTPGEVVFIDNWRVMHGRAAYSGIRHLGGAYISRTDWRSKATVLGLTDDA